MKDKVLQFCREQQLMRPGDNVVCAVSGGADSMAMLCCLRALRDTLGITVSAAHFNHRLRGTESDEDEVFVRGFCEKNGIPLTCGRGDAADYAASHGLSIEEAARELRYAFFAGLSGAVATAHTADDNAETVLMNLLRGSGLRGLAGIPPRRETVIRPMLAVTRNEVLAYLQREGVCWREDSTNAADDCRRNRIRHHVIPLLKEENPAFSRTVLAESLILREENAFLEEKAAEAADAARQDDGYRCSALQALPLPLLRRALLILLRRRGIPADLHHVETLRSLVSAQEASGQTGLPAGWTAVKSYGVLRFRKEAGPVLGSYPLPVPGTLRIPELSMEIRTAVLDAPAAQDENTVLLNYALLTGSITVRSRRTGDVIALSGGHRTLKRLMIDRKVPMEQRDQLPVLAMGETILSVYPLGVSRDFLPDPGRRVLAIQFKTYR